MKAWRYDSASAGVRIGTSVEVGLGWWFPFAGSVGGFSDMMEEFGSWVVGLG